MLKKYMEDHINIVDEVKKWEDSIVVASKILVDKNYISENYVQTMISNIKKNGPYVVMLPNVAIPHARPEEGAYKTTLSLLKLNKPVIYPESKEIRIIIILAAENNESHLELISGLADLLEDKEKMEGIINSESKEEILKLVDCY